MYEHLIGQNAVMDVGVGSAWRSGTPRQFTIAIVIDDVRRIFGRTEFLVRPAAGSGAPQWVSRDRVRVGP